MMIAQIHIHTNRQGLHEFTQKAHALVAESGVDEGLATFYIQHTSASLIIQENADPDVAYDLQNWINKLVPENDPLYTHVNEGSDDMPGHIKSMLTQTSIGVPILNSALALGTWQGLFLWEHRVRDHQRKVIVHIA